MTYSDRQTNAVSALNSYVWKVLEANVDWAKTDYNGLVPIIPRQQQPEFLQYAKPFIVYGSAQHPSNSFWGLKRESVAYNIYSTSAGEATGIANLLANVLERMDETATDINQHLDDLYEQVEHALNPSAVARKITFGSVKVTVTNDSVPSDEEGGFYTSLLMLDVTYTSNPTLNGTSPDIQTVGFDYS